MDAGRTNYVIINYRQWLVFFYLGQPREPFILRYNFGLIYKLQVTMFPKKLVEKKKKEGIKSSLTKNWENAHKNTFISKK